MFCDDFPEIVRKLLTAENASVCCLFDLDEAILTNFGKFEALFLDVDSTAERYMTRLRGTGSTVGWLYTMSRYTCSSDVGQWCIYCERHNELGVIGFRGGDCSSKFRLALEGLRAKPVEEACSESNPFFPFKQLVPEWRSGLIESYGR